MRRYGRLALRTPFWARTFFRTKFCKQTKLLSLNSEIHTRKSTSFKRLLKRPALRFHSVHLSFIDSILERADLLEMVRKRKLDDSGSCSTRTFNRDKKEVSF